jgi:hypothetical protein
METNTLAAIRGFDDNGKPTIVFTKNVENIALAEDVALDIEDTDEFLRIEAEKYGYKFHPNIGRWRNACWHNAGRAGYVLDDVGYLVKNENEPYYSQINPVLLLDVLNANGGKIRSTIYNPDRKKLAAHGIVVSECKDIGYGHILCLDEEEAKKRVKRDTNKENKRYNSGDIDIKVLGDLYREIGNMLLNDNYFGIMADKISHQANPSGHRFTLMYKMISAAKILDALKVDWCSEVKDFITELLKYEEGLKAKKTDDLIKVKIGYGWKDGKSTGIKEIKVMDVVKEFLVLLDSFKQKNGAEFREKNLWSKGRQI